MLNQGGVEMICTQKINVMLVDDNPNNLMSMEAILSDLNLNIVKASSGEEALRHLLSMDFAVIILDVSMPGMDGFETARMIRQRQQTRHIPIIFVTAYARTEFETQRGYELGAADYLFTPIVPNVFKSKVLVFVDLFRTFMIVKQQTIDRTEVNRKLYEAHERMVEICKELNKVTSRLEENVESQSHQLMTIESSYRSIFENVLEGIFQITEDGKILLANPAMVDMLGYDSCEQLMDAVPNVFQQLFVYPERGEEFRQRVSAGMVHGFEASIYTKDNNIIWVLLSANAVHGKDRDVYYEGVMINITEHKKLEEKLLRAEKTEAVARLAGETAHEIRNPLQVIQTGLYLLKMTNAGKEDEKTSKTINQMEHAVQRACKFIDELIDSSRIPELSIHPVNINNLLEGVVNEINISSSIRVDWELDRSLPNIPVDSERICEVMHNLVKNAMESMEQSSREQELRIKTELEKEFVRITISDTGKGMSEEELSNIWSPFYTSKAMGKGLGMTIVKRLIESHKGMIDVESTVGVGTVVVVRLMKSM